MLKHVFTSRLLSSKRGTWAPVPGPAYVDVSEYANVHTTHHLKIIYFTIQQIKDGRHHKTPDSLTQDAIVTCIKNFLKTTNFIVPIVSPP